MRWFPLNLELVFTNHICRKTKTNRVIRMMLHFHYFSWLRGLLWWRRRLSTLKSLSSGLRTVESLSPNISRFKGQSLLNYYYYADSICWILAWAFFFFRRSHSDIVHYTNLTIVSPNGVPFEGRETMDHATMIPYKGKYCYQYRKFVPCRVWMNVVHGIISQINRSLIVMHHSRIRRCCRPTCRFFGL